MKLRISIKLALSAVVLCGAGCASRNDLAYEKSRFRNPNRTTIAPASQQTDSDLPAVAAGPSGVGDMSWGGSISSR